MAKLRTRSQPSLLLHTAKRSEMDTVSPETRSRVMAQLRSQRNRSTEWRLRASLIRAGIRGWTLNPMDIPGKPDFAFREERLLLFVDGCYWHGCPRCYRRPSSNTDYWDAKVAKESRSRCEDYFSIAAGRLAGVADMGAPAFGDQPRFGKDSRSTCKKPAALTAAFQRATLVERCTR